MIPISAGLEAHLAQPYQTTCWMLKVTWTAANGGSVFCFTSTDITLPFDGNDYIPDPGMFPFDVASSSDLSVDNSQITGMLQSPSITIDDLRAGRWDGAQMEYFVVNWNNLSQGALVLRVGWIGEVRTGRNAFEAELRGLTQAFTRVIGQLTGPMCRNNVFDLPPTFGSACLLDPAAFTFSTTVDSVVDNQTILAAALNQAGPAAPVAISNITKANPGVVSTVTPLGLAAGAPIMIANCTGMFQVNGSTFIRNPSGSTFQLGVDTSAYPNYTGGGTVTPLGGASGYFDGGMLTFNDGLNAGLSMEVKAFVPGQLTLQLPMYYTIAPGDSFTVIAGCNKSLNTCLTKFANVINFNGEPYLPGIDKIIQVNVSSGSFQPPPVTP